MQYIWLKFTNLAEYTGRPKRGKILVLHEAWPHNPEYVTYIWKSLLASVINGLLVPLKSGILLNIDKHEAFIYKSVRLVSVLAYIIECFYKNLVLSLYLAVFIPKINPFFTLSLLERLVKQHMQEFFCVYVL